MKCKKSIMGLAALLIVLYHFWMQLTKSPIEVNIYRAAYIGVDLFFFVSAYSLGQKKSIRYGSFLANRALNIYLPFVILAGIAALYKHWSLQKFALTICGASFFTNGGGSFLWFAIAIMLLYLIAPFLVKLKNKLGLKALLIMVPAWAVLVCLLQFVFHYTTIFILLNRLPIFLVGLYFDELRKLPLRKFRLPVILAGLIGGGYLVYRFGGNVRLTKPLADMYYIIAIPFITSLVALFDFISEHSKVRNIPLEFIGGITFELYGLQMIFGVDIETWIFKTLTKSSLPMEPRKLLAFLFTTICLITMAWVFHLPKDIIYKIKSKKKEKSNS